MDRNAHPRNYKMTKMRAKAEKLKAIFVYRGLPNNRWDSLPEENYVDGYIVRFTVTGQYRWNTGSEQGISLVRIEQNETFEGEGSSDRVDNYISKIKTKLETIGFQVEFYERKSKERENLYTKRRWLKNKPPEEILRKIRIYDLRAGIEDLICEE